MKLTVGEIINVIGEEEEGWWRGSLNSKEGVFPSNFVEEIIHPPKPSIRENSLCTDLDLKPPKLPSKPGRSNTNIKVDYIFISSFAVKQLCEVKFSYKAQNDDELSLKKGEIITIISKDQQDPGWWKGELNGIVGVFPDNFVVLISNNEDKNTLELKEQKKHDTDVG